MTSNAPGTGPVEFLARWAAHELAGAKRFHEAAGAALNAAMEAAVEDLPCLYIPSTVTEGHLDRAVRLGARFLASAKEALEAIQGGHLEADMAFRDEMALDREERRRGRATS